MRTQSPRVSNYSFIQSAAGERFLIVRCPADALTKQPKNLSSELLMSVIENVLLNDFD